VDKVARRQLTKDVQPIGKRFAVAVENNAPSVIVHRGYQYKWTRRFKNGDRGLILPYQPTGLFKSRIKIDTRRARRRNEIRGAQWETLSVFTVAFTHRFINVLEFAGTGKMNRTREGWLKQSDNFIDMVRKDYGENRFVWGTIDNNPSIMRELQTDVHDTIKTALKRLKF